MGRVSGRGGATVAGAKAEALGAALRQPRSLTRRRGYHTAAEVAQAADRRAADHLPACPRCGDLSDPGSQRCGGCDSPLYTVGVAAPRPLAVVQGEQQPEADPMQQWWRERFTAAEIAERSGWVA